MRNQAAAKEDVAYPLTEPENACTESGRQELITRTCELTPAFSRVPENDVISQTWQCGIVVLTLVQKPNDSRNHLCKITSQ